MKKRVGKLASGAKAGAVLPCKPYPAPIPNPILGQSLTLTMKMALTLALTPDQVLLRKGRGGAEEDDDLEDGAPHVT